MSTPKNTEKNNPRWRPNVTVASVVEHNKTFLIVKEKPNSTEKPTYNQPAGHLEEGETLIQAAIRETLEETQWHIEPFALLGVSNYTAHNGTTYLRFSFAAKPLYKDKKQKLDEPIIEATWLTHQEIEALENVRSPMVSNDIQRFLSGTLYPLSLLSDFN